MKIATFDLHSETGQMLTNQPPAPGTACDEAGRKPDTLFVRSRGGVQTVKKRLADGTIKTYQYDRLREPKPKLDYEGRAYTNRLMDFVGRLAERAQIRAATNRMACDISATYVRDLVSQQGERCAVTGLKFELRPGKPSPYSPSLDRIDSKGGYTQGNVRIVCFAVNLALRDWGDAVFLKIAEAAVHTAWQKHFSPSL